MKTKVKQQQNQEKQYSMNQQPKVHFVKDNFGNNAKITLSNLVTVILYFLILIAPFIIIGLAVLYFKDSIIQHYLKFLIYFFGIWLIFFIFYIPILTILNNYRTKHTYHKHISYNQSKLKQKTQWLHRYYQHKFGQHLKQKKVYTVAKDNNIPVDYIIKHYKEKDKQE